MPQRDPNRNVSSEEWRPERVKGVEGRQEVARFSSENPFSDFQSLLFHTRQRRTGHVLGPHRPGQAALLQHEVVVGSGVHGVENVGVVRDPKLYRTRREREETTRSQSKQIWQKSCCVGRNKVKMNQRIRTL